MNLSSRPLKPDARLEIRERDGVFVLRLRVTPGARKRGLFGVHGGSLKVCVPEPPDKGKANEAVLRLLAGALGLAPANIQVLAGHASRDKQVSIGGFAGSRDELEARLS